MAGHSDQEVKDMRTTRKRAHGSRCQALEVMFGMELSMKANGNPLMPLSRNRHDDHGGSRAVRGLEKAGMEAGRLVEVEGEMPALWT